MVIPFIDPYQCGEYADGMAKHQTDTPCCPDALSLLDLPQAEGLANTLKAVADPVRLRLLYYISGAPGTTVCACHLPGALGITQPTLSHHLKMLTDAGLIVREQRGRWAYYRIDEDRVNDLFRALSGVVSVSQHCPVS